MADIDDIKVRQEEDFGQDIPGNDTERLDPNTALLQRQKWGTGNTIIGIDQDNGFWAGAIDFATATTKIALDGTVIGFKDTPPITYTYAGAGSTISIEHTGTSQPLKLTRGSVEHILMIPKTGQTGTGAAVRGGLEVVQNGTTDELWFYGNVGGVFTATKIV